MKDILLQVIKNKIFMTTLMSWVIAQTLKVSLGVIRERRFDFRWFVGTGGMPSSHAAGVSCLATAVGLEYGFDSVYFAITLVFTLIVMFDAQGVRRSAGRQARILNKVMEDIYWKGKIRENQLRELIGHTQVEVIVGSLLGIAIAFFAR
jgi:acid phosphatase family membrane protein YuiD